jgi:hypothetical protein
MYQEIEKLLEKYYEGETTLQEEKYIKEFFSKAGVPAHLQHHQAEFGYYRHTAGETPSKNLSDAVLGKIEKKGRIIRFRTMGIRIAAGVALVLGSFGAGYYSSHRSPAMSFVENSHETAIKETLKFEQVNQKSASERIDAVNQSLKLKKLDQDLIQLLINTLNFDDNVNVRLAACQALARFENEALVREGLIQSLKIQTDPNVQITLIELLVLIKEKRASQTLEQLSQDNTTMDVVRLKAQEGASKLITL